MRAVPVPIFVRVRLSFPLPKRLYILCYDLMGIKIFQVAMFDSRETSGLCGVEPSETPQIQRRMRHHPMLARCEMAMSSVASL